MCVAMMDGMAKICVSEDDGPRENPFPCKDVGSGTGSTKPIDREKMTPVRMDLSLASAGAGQLQRVFG